MNEVIGIISGIIISVGILLDLIHIDKDLTVSKELDRIEMGRHQVVLGKE